MESIISAVLVVGLIGLAFGLLLAFAAIVFRVEVDERIEKRLYIDEIIWFLPFIETIDSSEKYW